MSSRWIERLPPHLDSELVQFGDTRSINSGVASGIAMHRWACQHAL